MTTPDELEDAAPDPAFQRMLDAVPWRPVPPPPPGQPAADGIPWVTHEGVLSIAGVELRVFQLSDGQRIIRAEDLDAFLDAVDL